MPRNNKSSKSPMNQMLKDEQKDRLEKKVSRMLLPVADDSYGTVAISHSDLSQRLISRMSPFKSTGYQIFRYRGMATNFTISQTQTTPVLGSLAFAISQLAAAGPLLAVFDQFKIQAISVEFSPQLTSQPNAMSVSIPKLTTVFDYDDANPPTSSSALRGYDSVVVSPPGTGIVRTFIPHVADALYGGSTFSSYGNTEAPWIDSGSSTAQHYGLKYSIDAGTSSQAVLQSYSVDVTFFVLFRNVF